MATFDEFFNTLVDGIGALARETIQEYVNEATQDGKDFIEKTRDNLKKWTEDLAAGRMDRDEFTFLVKGQKDLAEMFALTQAGLAAVRVDKFRNAVIDLVVNTALGMF